MLRACRLVLVTLLLPTLLMVTPAPAVEAAAPRAAASDRGDLVARFDRLPGVVSVRERASFVEGSRRFVVQFRQPVDHARPQGATFLQRVVVMHRSVDRPTVLVTEGYGVEIGASWLSEPAELIQGNQVAVEHRFFAPSRPSTPNWSRQLTIRQAADDLHRVVTSFRGLYPRRWISTGVSKSGMAATFFRRFYPRDVAATVAYVAPNDVVDADDRYNDFLAQVGTQACRDALVAVQRRTLGTDRAWFLERTRRKASDAGWSFRVVGDSEKAFEAAVVDAYFGFWQYQPATQCRFVPGPSAGRVAVWNWYEGVLPLTQYADQQLRPYVPYYHQAVSQLGAPEPYETRIADLLRYPGADVAATFVPSALKPIRHDDRAMPDIDRWVRQRSHRMLFIYGGNDPWSAEPFACGTQGAKRDCHRFVVAGGTHGAQIGDLAASTRRSTVARVRRWAGLR